MRNILPTSTLESRNPIYKIEHGAIISKFADITYAFAVELPEIFTLTEAEYNNVHSSWVKAIKVLPEYSIVHKQDWFLKDKYEPKYDFEDFLSKQHQYHFAGRPFLTHKCYLYITKTTQQNSRKQGIFTSLCRGRIVPREMLSNEAMTAFEEAVEQFVSILSTSGYFTMHRLGEEELTGNGRTAGILDKYIMLEDSEQVTLRDIQLNPEGVVIGDRATCLHTLSELDDLPFFVAPHAAYDRLSTDNSDMLLSFAAPVGVLLDYNHIYNQYIFLDDNKATLRKLETTSRRMGSLAKLSRSNTTNYEYIEDFLNLAHSEGALTARAHFNVLSWTDEAAALREIKNEVGSRIAGMGCKPRHNTIDAPVLFWSGIPGNSADFPSEDTFLTFVEPAVCFFTFETYKQDSISPFGIKVTDRFTGRPLHLDISDEPMRKKITSNRNKFILGPSGSGKSFFTNHMVRLYYEQGAHVVMVDTGNSYLGLCQLIHEKTGGRDGIYLTYTEENPIAFNPFYTDDMIFDIEKKESIKTLILSLWKKDTDRLSRSEEVALSNAVNGYISLIQENQNITPCFNTFYEYIKATFREIVAQKNIREKDFDIDNFLNVLEPYYRGGEYDYLLNSDKQIDLLNKRFVVFELDNIKDHKILFPVVTIIIMETFINKMRRLKGIRKMILIEEAWKAIAKEGMAEYIKYLFKTVRKFMGEAIVVTQEVEDILSSPIVKESIINNSDCKILLDQSKYMNKFKEIQALLGLTDKQTAQVLSINQDLDPKRNYREVFIGLGATYSSVFGIEVSKAEYLTYTTEEREKTALFNLAKEKYNGNIEMAIRDSIEIETR
jgi:conjugation system TraG family ATPase